MKTSELPEWLLENEPRLFTGSWEPMRPLRPMIAGRTSTEAGWLAFQLIQQAESMGRKGTWALYFHPGLGAFMTGWADRVFPGWEPVKFDGYGSVASWKEANL